MIRRSTAKQPNDFAKYNQGYYSIDGGLNVGKVKEEKIAAGLWLCLKEG
jgi:hypothetical protein